MVAKIAVKLCLVFGLALGIGAAHAVPATVDYIIDGDTFAARVMLADDVQITVRVRISNVDTPELHGMCDTEIEMANRARLRLGQLLPIGSVVELTGIRDDKYLGRIDAQVFDNMGRDIGAMLIAEDLGRPYDGGWRASWCE